MSIISIQARVPEAPEDAPGAAEDRRGAECVRERALAREHRFPHMSSYQRMLVHRMAALYGLEHNIDPSRKAVLVTKQADDELVRRPACPPSPSSSWSASCCSRCSRRRVRSSPLSAAPDPTPARRGRHRRQQLSLSPSSTRSDLQMQSPEARARRPRQCAAVGEPPELQSQSLHASDRESVASSGGRKAERTVPPATARGKQLEGHSRASIACAQSIFQIRSEPPNTKRATPPRRLAARESCCRRALCRSVRRPPGAPLQPPDTRDF